MIGGQAICDRLEQQCLTSLGRRHNQTTLPTPDRRYQIDQTGREDIWLSLKCQLLVRENWCQLIEGRALAGSLGIHIVDQLNPQQRIVALALFWRANLAPDT